MNIKPPRLPTLLFVLSIPAVFIPAEAQDIAAHLITTDIDVYRPSKNPSGGLGPGVLALADHFFYDHHDVNYRISYFDLATKTGATVQVTEHSGGDSDRWLLHEAEMEFRNYFGFPGDSYVIREIDGHRIIAAGIGGWAYRWLSGNHVIHIEYTDLQMTKSEPLQIVEAYLAKYPSTLPPMTSERLRSSEDISEWVKNEMERTLWLCEKWFHKYESDGREAERAIREVQGFLETFLRYQEEFFPEEIEDLEMRLLEIYFAADIRGLRDLHSAYDRWWKESKDRCISLTPKNRLTPRSSGPSPVAGSVR